MRCSTGSHQKQEVQMTGTISLFVIWHHLYDWQTLKYIDPSQTQQTISTQKLCLRLVGKHSLLFIWAVVSNNRNLSSFFFNILFPYFFILSYLLFFTFVLTKLPMPPYAVTSISYDLYTWIYHSAEMKYPLTIIMYF